MNDLKGKTAVITGAASGIGFAMAERLAREGLKVVLADVDGPSLDEATNLLRGRGFDVASQVCDVTSYASMEALATFAVSTFGEVHVICNNAGIACSRSDSRPLWEGGLSDDRWAFEVNVWGVMNGVKAFVPHLLASGSKGYVVNTASRAGLQSAWGMYGITKHAVVAISESLSAQLQLAGADVDVCCVCPAAVKTNILNAAREATAPGEFPAGKTGPTGFMAKYQEMLQERSGAGKEPSDIAELVVNGMKNGQFYVLTNIQEEAAVKTRFENIIARRKPTPPVFK